jgi:hypothetical protein
MEPVTTALELLKRQSEIEARLRQPGAIRVTEERELYALRQALQRYPEAVKAILQTAANLKRPVDSLTAEDIRRLS